MHEPGEPRPGVINYLRGDMYALRPLDRSDAECAAAWWPEPYPVNAATALGWLEATQRGHRPPDWQLAVSRLADGVVVGSVDISTRHGLLGEVSFSFDPLVEVEERGAAAVETAGALLPWLLDERGYVGVTFLAPADLPFSVPAGRYALRPAGAIREALARPGTPSGRCDRQRWEATNPVWRYAWATPLEPLPMRVPERIDLTPGTRRDALRNPVAIGPRLFLRPMEATDSAEVARWFNEEPEHFFDVGRRPRSPLAEAAGISELYRQRPPETINFTVGTIADGAPVGLVGVRKLDWVNRSGDTHYFIAADHRGQGLGTEAKALLLAYCFDRLNLHLVTASVHGFNRRSALTLLKLGFRLVGSTRTSIAKAGRWQEDWLFDLLAREWFTQQR